MALRSVPSCATVACLAYDICINLVSRRPQSCSFDSRLHPKPRLYGSNSEHGNASPINVEILGSTMPSTVEFHHEQAVPAHHEPQAKVPYRLRGAICGVRFLACLMIALAFLLRPVGLGSAS